jgi:thiol-disulfide isomerase/thioredoxin
MRRWYGCIWVGLALMAWCNTGCKFLDRERAEREREKGERTAAPASRTKPTPKGGKNWQDGPTPGFDRGEMPAADSWADPNDPTFDVDREVRGILAGFVEDPDGRKVRDVYISVETVDSGKSSGAKVGVQTDPQGYFMIKGLKPRTTYALTTDVIKIAGQELSGRLYARTTSDRSQHLRITLIEGLSFPGSNPRRDRPTGSGGLELPTKPGDVGLAPSVFPDNGQPSNEPRSPSSGGTRIDPLLKNRDPDTGLPMPTPVESSPDAGNRPIPRNDLSVEGPAGMWRPPAASVPGGRSESKAVKPNQTYTLVDTLGVQREIPSGRRGEFILLDFMTTSCIPCKKAIPAIKDIQARYGLSGLEVIGINCDNADNARRRALASSYQRNEQLNYLIYAEPGAEPGKVANRLGARSFPTLVLLNHLGDVLWKGHPSDMDDFEAVLKDEIARAKR